MVFSAITKSKFFFKVASAGNGGGVVAGTRGKGQWLAMWQWNSLGKGAIGCLAYGAFMIIRHMDTPSIGY